MHPYDFDPDTPIVRGTEKDYLDFIESNYLQLCNGLKVLEVGPFNGYHTKIITKHTPSYLECVEPNARCKSYLEEIKGVDKIIVDDIWLRTQPQPFDIVICFGVLYHHHSALHLLELFVNCYNPKYIMLDCVTAEHPLAYLPEPVNVPGSRNLRDGWKHCGMNIKPPYFIVNQSLSNMGYKKKLSHKLQTNYAPKSNSWVALWEIKD